MITALKYSLVLGVISSCVLYTIVDIETTGNGLKGNRVTEISIFKFDGEHVVEEFTSLVNPKCPIPYFITGLTGIDDQMVAKAPTFLEIADQILDITKDTIFVAHSVNFDYGVIKEEFRQIGIDFSRKKLCTVRLSRKLIPGLQSYSLGKLCKAVSIPLTDRHRARGDAHATVLLFKKLIGTDGAPKVFSTFLNARSQEATLPPLLSKKTVNGLPSAPGVYYFKNSVGAIIYVGKAINIKKRVLGHFYDKSNHEIRLCREVADIDFELSGSELLALLMESEAIKKHYPKYNRAQKRTLKQYALFSYEDRNGIVHLCFDTLRRVANPLVVFTNQTECRAFLEELCTTFSLCPKYCHLQQTGGPCNHYRTQNCEGICRSEETVTDYNQKVHEALLSLKEQNAKLFIQESGRHAQEKAIIFVENGRYRGYGFIEDSVHITSEEDLEAHIILKKSTVETQRIIQTTLRKSTTAIF
ncbi:exonuclease domain-containing protein [uncultured Croceitalea sp.]|uniref:exonuclease domain-containing protein n=1 Tax=uncultured Croceitalea sp. TaxID=1798908 RepID=UPI00330563B2